MRVYLAGPIELVGIEMARAWREEAIRQSDQVFTSLELVNPMDFEPEGGPLFDEQIVGTDKFLINGCDALLVDGRQPGWGTAMEVFMAHQQHMLVVVWGIKREDAPIWLRYHSSHFELTLPRALEHLYEIEAGLPA